MIGTRVGGSIAAVVTVVSLLLGATGSVLADDGTVPAPNFLNSAEKADWRQFRGTADHRGWNTAENILSLANVSQLQILWRAGRRFQLVPGSGQWHRLQRRREPVRLPGTVPYRRRQLRSVVERWHWLPGLGVARSRRRHGLHAERHWAARVHGGLSQRRRAVLAGVDRYQRGRRLHLARAG